MDVDMVLLLEIGEIRKSFKICTELAVKHVPKNKLITIVKMKQ